MDFINLVDLNLGFITNLRGPQLLIIILVILLLFGSKRLPDLARSLGKAIKEFRKSASQMEKDFRSAMEEAPTKGTSPEIANTSATPTQDKTQI